MAATSTFSTEIYEARPGVTGIEVPPAVIDELGAGKKPAVVVVVGDYEYRSTVGVMGGKFLIPLSSDHRKASGLVAQQPVEVTLTIDDQPREVALPDEIEKAFAESQELRTAFEKLSPSRRKALVDPIGQAKAPETRQRRVDAALAALQG